MRDTMGRNGAPEDELPPAQRKAVAALIGGATVTAAAAAAGVGRSTVYRWLDADPAFVAELNRGLRDQADAARAELRALAVEALAVVRGLLTKRTPPALRL